MAQRRKLEERIVDTTLELAGEVGWTGVRLRRVAERLQVTGAELRAHFRDLDAVADAWLARADRPMLSAPEAGFAGLPARERLFRVITRWLDALAGHRAVTGQILAAKLYPVHVHHNVALVMWVSRTVQWIREAALLDGGGRRKQVEEIGLTLLFIATLRRWVRDESPGQADTRDFLARRLAAADGLMARLWPPPAAAPPGADTPSKPRDGPKRRAKKR